MFDGGAVSRARARAADEPGDGSVAPHGAAAPPAATRRPRQAPASASTSAVPAGFDTLAGPRGEVSPYFIARVSGAPVEAIEAMRGTKPVEALAELEGCEREIEGRREVAVERLHAAVGRAPSKRIRRALLSLKRDVFNGRPPKDSDLDVVLGALDAGDIEALGEYAASVLGRSALHAAYTSAYARDRDRAWTLLWRAVEAPAFRNGLPLASPTLHAQMERAREAGLVGANEADVDAATWRRLRKLERGLLRYLTRMAMKATPFGTLRSVAERRFAEDGAGAAPETGDALLTFEGDPSPARSVVRLNKRLCAPLIRQLQTRPAVCRAFEVELNPTLRAGEKVFEFLADSLDGEVFRRVTSSGIGSDIGPVELRRVPYVPETERYGGPGGVEQGDSVHPDRACPRTALAPEWLEPYAIPARESHHPRKSWGSVAADGRAGSQWDVRAATRLEERS